MKRIIRLAALGAALSSLAACGGGSIQETLGIAKRAPDEFAVVKQAPLIMPPNFALRPPEPGAPRPQELMPREQAQATLTGQRPAAVASQTRTGTGQRSAGEQALLGQARALNADASIRRTVNEEFTQLAERDNSFVDKLIFWQTKDPPGTIIDPAREQQRLREAAAAGNAPGNGPVPTIERKQKGWLEGIF
jgi:hypothetical protein